jgi:dipeptidase
MFVNGAGSLIWTTLQRAKTAREAISTIDFLMNTYGYASSGESFSIADNNEAWYGSTMASLAGYLLIAVCVCLFFE